MGRRCGFRYEKKLRALGVARIAGIDEAGRGALAGPVVAAAVILPEKFRHKKLNDSKQLLPELRQEIYYELVTNEDTIWAIGIVDSVEIDAINILRATHKAMRLALAALNALPDHVLIDGLPVSPFPRPQTAIIDGDCISLSIAAASVIAKVTRDAMMREATMLGMTMWLASPADIAEIHAALYAGLDNGTLRPVIGHELPLAEIVRAHQQVLEPGAYGKIVLLP